MRVKGGVLGLRALVIAALVIGLLPIGAISVAGHVVADPHPLENPGFEEGLDIDGNPDHWDVASVDAVEVVDHEDGLDFGRANLVVPSPDALWVGAATGLYRIRLPGRRGGKAVDSP